MLRFPPLMPATLSLVRPLLLTLYHRVRPGGVPRQWRETLSFAGAAGLYALLFAFLASAEGSFLSAVYKLGALKAFGSEGGEGLEIRLVAVGVSLGLGLLFAMSVAGSAARSLDTTREGRDLFLLIALPVRPGAVVLARALAAALLDPLGFLLLGPPMLSLALVRHRDAAVLGISMMVALYVALRALAQAAALVLILANRA